ncbi:MAG: hypothetical protein H0A76_10080 [Candidatus Thiodubiliella endoseptemdiera]|uniref:Uncharacterized protein n=1 Tax=Candidatus Thiodubiliella endoseptemdiera TaxID=2738886 RepID=A0A853F2N7_9GAMM|nr:hypothetical protein [Candidatus Thiodubiliella endoseptemdiera]
MQLTALLALAHSAMPSELADGKTYTGCSNRFSTIINSAISTSTAVTYDTINPIPITTNPYSTIFQQDNLF